MIGIYDAVRTGPMAIGPVVVRAGLNYKSRLNEVLDVASRVPVKTKDAYTLARKGIVGEEKGDGVAYIADNLTGVERVVVSDHERIGAALSLLGAGHNDTSIARTQLELYSECGDGEAYMLTLRGARNAEWISHDEFLTYMKKAYEAGYVER